MSGLDISVYERESVLPEKWLKTIDKFVYSDWYLLVIAALTMFFWALGAMVAGFVTMLLIISFLLVVKRDMTPCLPVLISVYCVISKGEFPPYFAYMFIILVPVAASLIFHFVYYRTQKIKGGAFGLAYLFVAASMFMGGVMSNQLNDEIKGLAFAAFLGLLPFAVYELIVNCCNGMDKKQFVRYTCRAIAFLGIIIVAQEFIYYIRVWQGIIPEGSEVHLGWGISNIFATVLLLTMPITMYVGLSEKKLWKSLVFAALSFAQFACIIGSVSRGAILVGVVQFVIMILATVIFNKHRKIYVLAYIVCIAAAIALCLVFKDKLIEFVERAFSNGLDGSGRDKIYKEAIRVFKENLFFGVGFGYVGDNSFLNTHPMYLFHSTLFQTMATLGLFGLVAAVYMYCKRIRFAFSYGRAFNIFLIVSCIGFEGYSLMDTFTFTAVPGLLLIAVLTAVNEKSNALTDEEYSESDAPVLFADRGSKGGLSDGVVFGSATVAAEQSEAAIATRSPEDLDGNGQNAAVPDGSCGEEAPVAEGTEPVAASEEIAAQTEDVPESGSGRKNDKKEREQ